MSLFYHHSHQSARFKLKNAGGGLILESGKDSHSTALG